jgi:ADP-ribose pyrophosphatase
MRPSKKIFQAKRFAIEEVEEILPNGARLVRNIVRHPGAVVVLPVVSADQICMINTYRVAIDRWNLELPAGTLDKSLTPIQTAELELQEETGYRCESLEHVHTFAMSPGILDEKMHFFVAKGLTPGLTAREEGEQMDNRLLTWPQIDQLLRDRKIVDAKSIACLLWYMRYRTYA